jgi:hypothetical protein
LSRYDVIELLAEAQEAFPAADGSLGRRLADALQLLHNEQTAGNRVDPQEAMQAAADLIRSGSIAEVTLSYTFTYGDGVTEDINIEVRRDVKPYPRLLAASPEAEGSANPEGSE